MKKYTVTFAFGTEIRTIDLYASDWHMAAIQADAKLREDGETPTSVTIKLA